MPASETRRVAITGIGVVSPFGVGRDCFWRHVRSGCSATRAIAEFDASPYPCTVAAPVPAVSAADALEIEERAAGDRSGRPDPRRYSKASLIALIAATEAWHDAGLRLNEPNAGVLVGSGAGGIDVAERQYFEFFTDRWKRVTPYAIPVSIVGMISSEISIALELHGISHVVSTGCSSTDAISYMGSCHRRSIRYIPIPTAILISSPTAAARWKSKPHCATASARFEKQRNRAGPLEMLIVDC
jgi:3-oxoacyl-[acyl-carrier-protein] synthase II